MDISTNDIEKYLEELQTLIRQDWFEIDFSRGKNRSFIEKYRLKDRDIKKILLDLKVTDYVERVATQNEKYHSEYLYIFKKLLSLDDSEIGTDEYVEIEVCVYIKTAIPKGNGFKTMIVVSFHADEM